MNIALAINYVNYSDSSLYMKRKGERQKVALDVLEENSPSNVGLFTFNYKGEKVDVSKRFHVLKKLQRNSQKEILNDRPLPYVKELFDLCSEIYCDAFGFMNSDILLTKDFFDLFDRSIDAYVFYRTDISEVTVGSFNKKEFRVVDPNHAGNDAFFFRRDWWLENRKHFHDDLILGETEWDTCYREIIKRIAPRHMIKRSLYHVYHDAKWKLDSKGALNNLNIWNELRNRIGM